MGLTQEEAWPLAQQIAGGHAWTDHRDDFPQVMDQSEFAAAILRILVAPTDERALRRGRTAYWDEPSGILVILNPEDDDAGTCFRPEDGRAFFERAR